MPTLKDLSLMTGELDRLGGQLHAELIEGADKLAGAFNTMSKALEESLAAQNGSGGDDDSSEEES